MSTSMISTVLEIEGEAEAILLKADQDAAQAVAEAKEQRETAKKTYEERIRKEIADLETAAAAERAKKIKELSATGEAALSAVRNISDAAFSGGVQHVLKVLAEK